MGHIVNPHLFRLNYVVFWSAALINKRKFSAYFDTRNLFINEFIDLFFKRYKNMNEYALYLLFFKIIYNNNTFSLFLIFKQHKNFLKFRSKSILVKKVAKNFMYLSKKNFVVKYLVIKKNGISPLFNYNSLNFFLKKFVKNNESSSIFKKIILKNKIKKSKSKKFVKKFNKNCNVFTVEKNKNKKFFLKRLNKFSPAKTFFPENFIFNINRNYLVCFKKNFNKNNIAYRLKHSKKKLKFKRGRDFVFHFKKKVIHKVKFYNKFIFKTSIKTKNFFLKNKKLYSLLAKRSRIRKKIQIFRWEKKRKNKRKRLRFKLIKRSRLIYKKLWKKYIILNKPKTKWRKVKKFFFYLKIKNFKKFKKIKLKRYNFTFFNLLTKSNSQHLNGIFNTRYRKKFNKNIPIFIKAFKSRFFFTKFIDHNLIENLKPDKIYKFINKFRIARNIKKQRFNSERKRYRHYYKIIFGINSLKKNNIKNINLSRFKKNALLSKNKKYFFSSENVKHNLLLSKIKSKIKESKIKKRLKKNKSKLKWTKNKLKIKGIKFKNAKNHLSTSLKHLIFHVRKKKKTKLKKKKTKQTVSQSCRFKSKLQI